MMEFTFEVPAWQAAVDAAKPGSAFSGARLVTLLAQAEDAQAEDALQALEDKRITLDISDLPRSTAGGQMALRLRQEEQLAQKGELLTGLEENDPLRLYLQELAAIPAYGDVQLLAQRCAAGEEAAAGQLVNLMLAQAVELAKEYMGHGVLLLDLIQEASLGLWQGIGCYREGDILDHCRWWIRQYLAKAVILQASATDVGQKLRQGLEDFRQADEQLLSQLGRNPALEEIAQFLHITVEEAEIYEKTLQTVRVRSKLEQQKKPKEPEPEDDQHVEDTAYFQLRQRISELLSTLPGEEAKLLTLRYGLEGKAAMSPEETGKVMGLTPAEVVEREAAALAKLRTEA